MFDLSTPAAFLSVFVFLPAVVGAVHCRRSAAWRSGQMDFARGDGGRFHHERGHDLRLEPGEVRAGVAEMQNQFSLDWIPSLQHPLHHGHRRHQLPARAADRVRQPAGDGRQLADHEARKGLLHSVPAAGNRHARRVLGARLLPVLRVLGSDAAADVLPDRRLGRPAQGICRDQVLPVHAARQRVDADRDFDALLRQRPAQAERRATHCHRRREPDRRRGRPRQTDAQTILSASTPQHTFNILALQQIGQHPDAVQRPSYSAARSLRMVGVHAAVHRLRDQGAQRAAPHVAARCARRSADADLDDPGRRAAEDGRLRHHSHLLPDLSRSGLRPGVCRLRSWAS